MLIINLLSILTISYIAFTITYLEYNLHTHFLNYLNYININVSKLYSNFNIIITLNSAFVMSQLYYWLWIKVY